MARCYDLTVKRILPFVGILIATVAPSFASTTQIAAEQPIAPLSPAPPEGPQSLGAIATDGVDSLVFWSGMGGFYATPVTADGKVGTRTLITLSGVSGISACWTGSVYLTTWEDAGDNSIHEAVLSRDGLLASPPALVIAQAHGESGTLAGNGRRELLAYASNGAIRGALFDSSGAVVSTGLLLPVTNIDSTQVDATLPRVSTDGNNFALVWRSAEVVPVTQSVPPPLTQTFHTFHLQQVDDSAIPTGAPITIAKTLQTGLTFGVAFGGGVYAVDAIAGGKLVRFTVDPVSATGTALPPIDASGFVADVVWNGNGFVAYWMNYSVTSFALMTVPFSGNTPLTAASGTDMALSPLLLRNGSNLLGAWSESLFGQSAGESSIRGATFDANATVTTSAPFLISVAWSRQFAPAIATSGSDSLVVWIDSNVVNAGRLLGLRVATDGTPIDSTPFEIASNASVSTTPLATFAGASYLVIWQDPNGSGIVARRVGRDASLGPILSFAGYSAAVASNANKTLVVLTGTNGIAGFRLDPNCNLIDTTPITVSSDNGHSPQVATNGTDFFVAWNIGTGFMLGAPVPSIPLNVYGTRVFANGAVDVSPLEIATASGNDVLALVGSDGRDYTVFYGSGSQLAAKRVLREGTLDGTTAEDLGAIVASDFYPQAIVSDSGGFWLAGTDGSDYYAGSLVLLHTDAGGNPAAPLSLASYNTPLPFPPRPARASATSA